MNLSNSDCPGAKSRGEPWPPGCESWPCESILTTCILHLEFRGWIFGVLYTHCTQGQQPKFCFMVTILTNLVQVKVSLPMEKGLELDNFSSSFPPKLFCDFMILWQLCIILIALIFCCILHFYLLLAVIAARNKSICPSRCFPTLKEWYFSVNSKLGRCCAHYLWCCVLQCCIIQNVCRLFVTSLMKIS